MQSVTSVCRRNLIALEAKKNKRLKCQTGDIKRRQIWRNLMKSFSCSQSLKPAWASLKLKLDLAALHHVWLSREPSRSKLMFTFLNFRNHIELFLLSTEKFTSWRSKRQRKIDFSPEWKICSRLNVDRKFDSLQSFWCVKLWLIAFCTIGLSNKSFP